MKGIGMSNKKNRSGTSRDNKVLAALHPDYVSVEERSIADLLMYARAYAQKVRFYNEHNQVSGTWAAFLDFTDDQILELAQFVENPDIFRDDSVRLEQYSKPHLALLLTFLKLLQYPQEQFAALTEKNVAYFYENILQLEKQDEVPDQVHAIFTLARDVKEHELAAGTLLAAGKDDTGVDLHYQVTEDVVLNQAKVTVVRTIHLTKTATDLKYVHQSNNQGDAGFEKMLCLALGLANLPDYETASGQTVPVDAAYLRTDLYKRINGKEKDELLTSDANYILDSLCFRSLQDFLVCLNLLYREINRGYAGITYPEDQEWETAYTILGEVHRERLARLRRAELKALHRESGFDAMMEYAFGEPEPGNMLYKMPDRIATLEELATATNEAARQYIENKLCMTGEDFQTIMAKKDTALTGVAGEEVYALLEAAWTQKRNYQYPEIGTEIIDGFYADPIFDAATDDGMKQFAAFGAKASATESENINLGFAVSSPLLNLAEGARQIEMVVSCEADTIDHDAITALLAESDELFTTWLTTENGWQETDVVTFEHGKFIVKPEVKTYDRKDCALVCDISKYSLTASNAGVYIGFADGKIYEINRVAATEKQMYLNSTYLEQTADTVQLITKLLPKTFVAELKTTLEISKYALSVTSDRETFAENFEGKYIVDHSGKIFLVKKFINANTAELRYCGALQRENSGKFNDASLMLLNKVWETIDFEVDTSADLSDLVISGISAAEPDCAFEVTDAALKITYPEGTTAGQLLAAWEDWLDQEDHDPGRYEITGDGAAVSFLTELSRELEPTGEVMKRYESLADNGLKVTYLGRPTATANLVINAPSTTVEQATFLVSGDTLTITPGKVAQTANQITAAWRLWLEDPANDPRGFAVESKDEHCWEAVTVSEAFLSVQDKQVKKCEVTNLYGVGIRVRYTGPVADEPRLILAENTIDMFEFAIDTAQTLTIKYPAVSDTSADDLVAAWDEWRASKLNDPGNFSIETLGDGLWTIKARTEKELQASEGQTIECTIQKDRTVAGAGGLVVDPGYDAGITARFNLSVAYNNAVIEFVKNSDENATEFSFAFSDEGDVPDQPKTKKLTITYPPLRGSGDDSISDEVKDEYRTQQVQNLLSKWNRIYQKHGLALIRTTADAKWSLDFPDSLRINFLENLNYICTMDSDGFVVKYRKPNQLEAGSQYTEVPRAKVIIAENDTADFAFRILNDYPNNTKILYIYYSNEKADRTVAQLLEAWNNTKISAAEKFKEFDLGSSGTGKWEITATTEVALTNEVTAATEYTDPINYDFHEYKTNDVNGFTLYWAGPKTAGPQVTMVEHEQEFFKIEVAAYQEELYDVTIGSALTISYPQRSDKRRLVDLLTAWQRYKNSVAASGNFILGFEIVDTSLTLKQRAKAPLLVTGDRLMEYHTGGGNGLGISYIGHRDDPMVILEPIRDFTDSVAGQKILWDNGQIFTVTEKLDRNNITVAATNDNIAVYDGVKLYEADAFCLEGLKFTIHLDQNFEAIAPLSASDWASDPACKILLKQTAATGAADSVAVFYNCFKALCLERLDLKVTVQGLTDMKMRGNIAMINPDNPFVPFGQTPGPEARFYFAHPEICAKKLDSLQMNIDWVENQYLTAAGLPDLEKYYYAYSHCGLDNIGTIRNKDFEINLQFWDQRSWVKLSETPQALFASQWLFNDFSRQTYQGALFPADQELPKDPLEWPRLFKLELSNQGFLPDYYAELCDERVQAASNNEVAQNNYDMIKQEIRTYTEQVKAAKLAEAEARANGDAYYQPVIAKPRALPTLPENDRDIGQLTLNAPYTPEIQSLSIDYTASAQLLFGTATDSNRLNISFFRLHPSGYEMVEPSDPAEVYLLPQYDQTGYLMIGIADITPGQTVSLLFQMVAGSGDASLTAPEITWSYLADNQWVDFETTEILKDQTYGLQNTGIIRFTIPETATTNNTVLPGTCCWFRAAVAENPEAVPDILDIRAQAVCVTYVNQGNDPEHLASPLAVDSITELDTRDAEIKGIEQPYTSFGGKREETSENFYARVSERLKHKNRALTLDDYEKLVLNQFPEVYKVKCIPREELDSFEPENKGKVVVIVILKNANAAPFFPLKPKTPANLLEEITAYLKAIMPPAVKTIVRNPRFEEVTYRLAVKFSDGYDRGYYLNKLNDDLKRFLSPWAYDRQAEINFGSTVYSASLINYLEKQSYVDYIANFNPLRQTIKHATYTEELPLFLSDDNSVTTKYPDSILVSAANHVMDVITTEFYDPGAFQGIGYMEIESDFWLARPGAIFSVGIGEMEIEAWPVLRYAFAEIPVTVSVKATVGEKTYHKDQLTTQFSRADSQLIWNTLMNAGYLDTSGNVVTAANLDDEKFTLLGGAGKFDEYLQAQLSKFTFQITAADFDSSAGKQTEFSYQVLTIDTTGLETAAVNLLKAGLSFAGFSQYPMTVY
jgi:hypothetical protein